VASYRIWNADGSIAQQCGNGARCIAAWLLRDGAAPATGDFAIDSPAGRHAVVRDADGDFAIDMGMPDFAPQSLPMRGCEKAQDEYVLELDGIATRFGAVSMGNPHVVIEAADLARAPVRQLGAALQAHAAFPASVNVGFVEVVASDHLRLRVFERGAGETLACGSGACAAVAVLTRRGRLPAGATVAVDLPGGRLRIQYDPASGHVRMGGPTAFVFDGTMFGEDQP
jgi:diaminopimelate epimerase